MKVFRIPELPCRRTRSLNYSRSNLTLVDRVLQSTLYTLLNSILNTNYTSIRSSLLVLLSEEMRLLDECLHT